MTSPVPVPPEVITAAAQDVAAEMRKHPVFTLSLADERLREIAFELAVRALEAAAPHLAAAEREACAILADQAGADYYDCPHLLGELGADQRCRRRPFAALLREDQP